MKVDITITLTNDELKDLFQGGYILRTLDTKTKIRLTSKIEDGK